MSESRRHSEWISLIDKIGPFLSLGVLEDVCPQGFEKVDNLKKQRLFSAYEEWSEAVENGDLLLMPLHSAWIHLVLEEFLEYDSAILKSKDPSVLKHTDVLTGEEITAEYVVYNSTSPYLFIQSYGPNTNLNAPISGTDSLLSPIDKMRLLCRESNVPLAIVTNGEEWTLLNVPKDECSSQASWYSRIWRQEPSTLQAFYSLLSVRRCYGTEEENLKTLFELSLKHQDDITTTLGEQVCRAVEVLIQALDRSDLDHNRELLKDVLPSQLYEAGLTVMMRLVFILCAEERKLLLLGEETYDQFYAVSTLRSQLREESERQGLEILERRYDAWSRLLSTFRILFGGIEHEALRFPPLGGSLFDPDRYPFLEGRSTNTSWITTNAVPLPIDNRTVLLILTALQVLEQKQGAQLLSYQALDVEQIGHVYEGLLERTVIRVPQITLGLIGSHKVIHPTISLEELESSNSSEELLIELLVTSTQRTESSIRRALHQEPGEVDMQDLLQACSGDTELAFRIKPYINLIRTDSWGGLLVYPQHSFLVAFDDNRRRTGTHYTPKLLTEPVVQNTLAPLVYEGAREGKSKLDWRLKKPEQILQLKICDMAMGSAAFLVQVCRWLAERLVESWDNAERLGKKITLDGKETDDSGFHELLVSDREERLVIARRLIASRCIYGVDINPMAVELAKLSLWLITMQKNRPFNFLDHALKCGDSLLGVTTITQLENFSLREGAAQMTTNMERLLTCVGDASLKRSELEHLPSDNFSHIEIKNRLHSEVEQSIKNIKHIADVIIGIELEGQSGEKHAQLRSRVIESTNALLSKHHIDLENYSRTMLKSHSTFHWPLEFPEVFDTGGFDAIVGNPPFLWGLRIAIRISIPFSHFLKRHWPHAKKNADLCAFFLLRAVSLLKKEGTVGLILTNTISEADTRETSLDYLISQGNSIYRAVSNQVWPGTANVRVSTIHISKSPWKGSYILDDQEVENISSSLEALETSLSPNKLLVNSKKCFKGSVPLGDGFFLSENEVENIIEANPKYRKVIFPYLTGEELNSSVTLSPGRWVIYFRDWSLEQCEEYPLCLDLLRVRVKPVRDKIIPTNNMARQRRDLWWKFTGPTIELYDAIKDMKQVIVGSAVSKHHALAFVPSNYIYSNALNVFAYDSEAHLALYQSTIHSIWAFRYGSKMKNDPRYNVTDCFETFPQPQEVGSLLEIGKKYNEHRNNLMNNQEKCLTELYNSFNDRNNQTDGVQTLRTLHVEMDYKVCRAFGLHSIELNHGFHQTQQGEKFTISKEGKQGALSQLLVQNIEQFNAIPDMSLKKKVKKKTKESNQGQQTLMLIE